MEENDVVKEEILEEKKKEVKEKEKIEEEGVNKKINLYCLFSLIFSLVSFFIGQGYLAGIAAIVLAIFGMIRFDKEKQKGKWMAKLGLCIGIFNIIYIIIVVYNDMKL